MEFTPTISWQPGQTLATADYYEQITDTLRLAVIVTAQNQCYTARDTVVVTLIKEELTLAVTPGEIRPRRAGGVDTATITVTATRGGAPLSGVPVHLDVRAVDSSGGHAHTAGRPTGFPGNSDGVTNANGIYRTTFYANYFGGEEWIVASSSELEQQDSVMITIRVPNLVELGPGSHYELVGTPDNHSGTNDPCRDSTTARPRSRHYRNHYGTARLVQAVQKIAAAYDSVHPGIKLRINDMSLVYGGLFDAAENDTPNSRPWQPPHSEHRIGINADIGYSAIDSLGGCVTIIDTTDAKSIIFDITKIEALNHRPPGPPAPHFHIYVRKD